MSVAQALEPPSRDVIDADLAAFAALLRDHYGARLEGVYLFGSRARGDARDDSDADVAVVLDEVGDFWKEVKTLCGLSFDFLVRDGVYIEAKPVAVEAWREPERDFNPSLVHAMKRDGKRIQAGP